MIESQSEIPFIIISQDRLFNSVTIVLVGKYTDLRDSYISVIKALGHSVFRVHRKAYGATDVNTATFAQRQNRQGSGPIVQG